MNTALLVIATGLKYRQYVEPLLHSANEFFVEHEAIVWSDQPHDTWASINIVKPPLGFPGETLYRYHTFLSQQPLLRQYDQLFYVDVDSLFVAPVGEEIFSNGITATLHPGYCGNCGTPERRRESFAFISPLYCNSYFCGGFNGGDTDTFLRMARNISWGVDMDAEYKITAVWHDESHLNRFLYDNPPAKILDPSYCYPEVDRDGYYSNKWKAAGLNVTPKILALEKK